MMIHVMIISKDAILTLTKNLSKTQTLGNNRKDKRTDIKDELNSQFISIRVSLIHSFPSQAINH
jgi:hypothetical protein